MNCRMIALFFFLLVGSYRDSCLRAVDFTKVLFKDSDRELLHEGEDKLVLYLDQTAQAGDVYAIRTNCERVVAAVRKNSGETVSPRFSQQTILFDRKANRWTSFESGVSQGDTLLVESYFDGKHYWQKDRSTVADFGGNAGWLQVNELRGPFNPETAWLGEPWQLSTSFRVEISDFFAGVNCVAAQRHDDGVEFVYSKSKSPKQRVNRVTSLFFRHGDDLPSRFRVFGSALGDFDAKSVVEVSKNFSLDGDLKWKPLPGNAERFVLEEMKSRFHSEDLDSELRLKNEWVVESAIAKEFLLDPRKEGARSLSELSFRKER